MHPETVDVMESMLLDGTEERQDVADYVQAVSGGGLGSREETKACLSCGAVIAEVCATRW